MNMEKENPFYGVIKTYVIRIGRMTAAQEKAYEDLSAKWCIPYEKKQIDYKTIFGNDNPVTIEIGFGMGAATSIIAEQNPDKNYIGIEVHKPGVGKLLSEINEKNLTNLRIIEYDAIEVLKDMIADNSVDAFHIFFPDPWPKKRHHKRRLVQRPRTNLIASKIKTGGYFYFVTDWLEYAEFGLDELNATEGLQNKYEKFAEHQEWRPETKFEKRGIDELRPISELYFIKK